MAENEAIIGGPVLAGSQAAAALLGPRVLPFPTERIEVAHLDPGRRLLGFTRATGTVAAAAMPLREIIRAALDWNSHALVVAHNHPSGDPRPSRADLDATRRLILLAHGLGIEVLDHLVFAGTDWTSMRAQGFF